MKAFGDCINKASKLSGGPGGSTIVSKQIKDKWPSSKGGKVSFGETSVSGQKGYNLNQK